MKLALLFFAISAHAQDYSGVDEAMKEATAAVTEIENCQKTYKVLLSDFERKRAELSKEFGGKIPPAFNDLLTMKRKRVDRQQNICIGLNGKPDPFFVSAHDSLQRFEPPGHPGVIDRRKKLAALRKRYNDLISGRASGPKSEQPGQ